MSCRRIVTGELVSTLAHLLLLSLLITPLAVAQTVDSSALEVAKQDLPEAKQTTVGLYVTAGEAYERWMAAPESVTILDVRTPEEFLFVGHAPMAWNIPAFVQSYEWDADKGRFPMTPNPDFVSSVQKIVGPDDTLLIMCRSGGRSAKAVDQLAAAGFRNVYNIVDGMEGDMIHDAESPDLGHRVKNGWKNSDVPWTYEIDPDRILIPGTR